MFHVLYVVLRSNYKIIGLYNSNNTSKYVFMFLKTDSDLVRKWKRFNFQAGTSYGIAKIEKFTTSGWQKLAKNWKNRDSKFNHGN